MVVLKVAGPRLDDELRVELVLGDADLDLDRVEDADMKPACRGAPRYNPQGWHSIRRLTQYIH